MKRQCDRYDDTISSLERHHRLGRTSLLHQNNKSIKRLQMLCVLITTIISLYIPHNTKMMIDFINNAISPAIHQFNRILAFHVLDKAKIHYISKINQALQQAGLNDMQILIMPSQASKYINTLDNVLLHEWKEQIRKHTTLEKNIKRYYNLCDITREQIVYSDCLLFGVHHHCI